MGEAKLDLLQGTLDLMVLQTLAAMGSQHGYGIARRIEQVSGDAVLLNQGTIYASLVRLQQRGWISAEWGTSDNNRKAKFYEITKLGRKQLAEDAALLAAAHRRHGPGAAMQDEGRPMMSPASRPPPSVRCLLSKAALDADLKPNWPRILSSPSKKIWRADLSAGSPPPGAGPLRRHEQAKEQHRETRGLP